VIELAAEYDLTAIDGQGEVVAVSIAIVNERPAEIDVVLPGWSGRISGGRVPDFFSCMEALRRKLEGMGYLLCCQGARRDVAPSGMTRQMSNGRLMTVYRPGASGAPELVDIFAPADCAGVVSFDQQKSEFQTFLRSRRREDRSD
jgi:hypothetical protein